MSSGGTEASWVEPQSAPGDVLPDGFRENSEHPQIAFDGKGRLHVLFRPGPGATRALSEARRSGRTYLMLFDGSSWSTPRPLMHSGGSIEKHPRMTRDPRGELWAAWMTDERPFATMVPQNAEVYVSRLGARTRDRPGADSIRPLQEPFVESIPVHEHEAGM